MAQRLHWLVFHGEHVGGRHDAKAIGFGMGAQGGLDGLGLAHKQDLGDRGIFLKRLAGTGHSLGGPAVASHHIHRNAHGLLKVGAEAGWLGLTFDGEDLPALVEAAAWANPMGLCGHSALRAILQLGQLEHTVGGLALAAAAT